jgi:class 3 adenylate cyclase
VEQQLKSIGPLISEFIHYNRYSIYVDFFALGMNDRPGERFHRLSEGGYTPAGERDKTVDIAEGQGLVMLDAIQVGTPKLGRGADEAWYSVVPLGKFAVMNFSDDRRRPKHLSVESHEFLKRAFPALKMFDLGLTEFAARMNYALEVLRLIRGDGAWTEKVGCVFLDINGFDDQTRRYGTAFSSFVSQIYLPAICKRVRRWLVREGTTKGDSAYLICLTDLMQEKQTIEQGTYLGLAEILRFVHDEGAAMCKSRGFDPIRLQIGCSIGDVTIICDEHNVRSSGSVINEAARLQAAARPGEALASSSVLNLWPPDDQLIFCAGESIDLVKTRKLRGVRIELRRARANGA